MNYIGCVLSQNFSGDFLKEALRKADKKMPFRGSEYYQNALYFTHSPWLIFLIKRGKIISKMEELEWVITCHHLPFQIQCWNLFRRYLKKLAELTAIRNWKTNLINLEVELSPKLEIEWDFGIIDFTTYFLFFCILLANILSACEKADWNKAGYHIRQS